MMMIVFRVLVLATAAAVAAGQGCLTVGGPCPQGATEGPILTIGPMSAGDTTLGLAGLQMTVMGAVTIYVPESSFTAGGITSGSGVTLTSAMALDTTPLPGRPNLAGFRLGTAKCGVTDIVDGLVPGSVGAMVGRICVLEPSENIMTATVTRKNVNPDGSCQLFVGDQFLELVPILDTRYAFQGAKDTEGFDIVYCSIPVGALVGGEGYYGVGENPVNRFHIFLVESDMGTRVGASMGLTTISRTRCRVGNRLEVQGSVTNQAVTTVVVTDATTNAVLGTPVAVGAFDPVVNAASWRLRVNNVAVCPATVTATASDGSLFTVAVNIG
jgi:hypothetical protein